MVSAAFTTFDKVQTEYLLELLMEEQHKIDEILEEGHEDVRHRSAVLSYDMVQSVAKELSKSAKAYGIDMGKYDFEFEEEVEA